jgi:hypothetical protein
MEVMREDFEDCGGDIGGGTFWVVLSRVHKGKFINYTTR